jgi:hypothetical protein
LTPRRTEELAPELVGAEDKEGDEQEHRTTAAALSDAEAAPVKDKEGDSSSKENNAVNDNADEEDKSKRPFLILCLDGGGLKSVLEATILERYTHVVHDDNGIRLPQLTHETSHRIAFQPSDGVP